MERVVVFTGAGVSVPLGLPSTMDFMNSVQVGLKPVTNFAISYLGSSGNDIEWLLSTLETFNNEMTFTEYLIPFIAPNNSGTKEATTAISAGFKRFRSDAVSEIARIKKIIFDKLGKFDSKNALSLYKNLISEIRSAYGDCSICLVTTNYDLTFESAIETDPDIWKSLGIKEVEYGFSIQFGRPIYSLRDSFDWSSSSIEYIKIHGSVDWHRDAMGRCTRSMSSTVPDDPDQMAILYPGFKGVPNIEPFISLHGRLSRKLAEADRVVVIGFAFRDAYINNIFENILRARPSLPILYFNPISIDQFPQDSAVPHLVGAYANFRHIARGIEISDSSLNLDENVKSG